MSHMRAWKRFLDIRPEELALVHLHADTLAGSADALAQRFYAFLLSHPETAAVFRAFDEQHLRRLTEKQAEHYRHMLLSPLDGKYESELERIGTIHHQWGVSPIWVVSAYRLYIEHLEAQMDGLPALPLADRRMLREALIKRVLYDMAVQLAAYEKARHAEKNEQMAVVQVLLDTAAHMTSVGTPEEVFAQVCDRLVVASPSLHAVWFAVIPAGAMELVPAHVAGKQRLVPHRIALTEQDPLRQAIRSGRPVVVDPHAANAPDWCQGQSPAASVGIFPFGMGDEVRGVGVVYADQSDYFARIDLSPFGAFAHLGDLLMELKREAQSDPLTGLPNRKAFSEHLEPAISRSRRHDRLLVVGLLDLDDFKPVNDRYGHAVGDALLREVGQRLRVSLRANDLATRLGGDEFAFILEDVQSLDALETTMQRIGTAIFTPFELPDGSAIEVKGSVGVTVYPFDEGKSEELLRHADQAMYVVKGEKSRRKHFWDYWQCHPAMEMAKGPRFQLAEQAIAWFQPVLSLQKRRIVAVEALARIVENGQVLTPDQFLPLLSMEERRELSRFMLTQGLQLLEFLDQEGFPLELSFNVDPDFIAGHDCASFFTETVTASPINPQRVTVEILETGDFLNLAIAQQKLTDLKATGAKIALDDVGSAYSSLLRLKHLPIDEIKLDQDFIRDLPEIPENLAFVQSIRSLAQGLRVCLVVEGVETEEILDAMASLGVDRVQGYAIARPMSARVLASWLRDWRPEPLPDPDFPHTLLGAYAAHVRRRPLMECMMQQDLALVLSSRLSDCPLVAYVQSRGWNDHPVIEGHRQFMEGMHRLLTGHGANSMSPDEYLAAAEQELANLIRKELKNESEQARSKQAEN